MGEEEGEKEGPVGVGHRFDLLLFFPFLECDLHSVFPLETLVYRVLCKLL